MSQFSVSAWAADTQFSASFAAADAGDQRFSSASGERWAASSTAFPHWLRADLGTAQTATWYRVDPGRSGSDPSAWTFQGSNDASAWTTLDTQSSQTFSAQTKTYTFSNSTAYRYYRLNISAGGANAVSVAELEIGDGTPHGCVWEHQTASVTLSAGDFTTGLVFTVNSAIDVTHLLAYVGTTTGTWALRIRDSSGTVVASASYSFNSGSDTTGWREVSITPVTLSAGNYMVEQHGGGNRYSQRSGSHASAVNYGPGSEVTVPQNGTVTFRSSTNTSRQSAGNTEPTSALGNEAIVGLRFVPATVTPTATVAATLPAMTAASATTVTQTGTVAAALPALGASAAAEVTAQAAVSAALPSLTAEALAVADDTSFADVTATLPALSAAASAEATYPVEVAAALPSLSAAVEATSTPPGDTVVATLPALSATVVVDSGLSLEPWTDGLHGDALIFLDAPAGVLEVDYPTNNTPLPFSEIPLSWQSHETAVVGGNTNGMTSVPLGIPRIWVDGVDVTFFRGVRTRFSGWRTESPFGWTSTTLTFPPIFHYEQTGVGDLAWLRTDAPVEIAIVTPEGDRHHRFTGHLTSDDPGVGRGRTESVWQVEGALWQADHARHPVPARLDPTDIGTLIAAELNDCPSRRYAHLRSKITGIKERKRGSLGQTRWEYVTDLLAGAVREDGKQWTLEPVGRRSFDLALKDTTTVHWTVTAGAPGVELDLSRDDHERIDAVYGYGVAPDGYAWRNVFFPDLLPYDPPNYPYADPDQNVLLGATDAGTLTGTGVSDWQRRIRDLGYTRIAVDGVMGSADIAAVRWIQRLRGIQVDGYLGPQTWAATWNVGTIGGDLTSVRLPLAVRSEVEPYVYAANGAVVGNNPDYDPSIIRHEVDVDFGHCTKAQGEQLAQRMLERGSDPGIAGTIRLMTCPWEGPRWLIDAGQNVLLKGYRGADVLMRVVAVDADPESQTVTLTVDSEFRDAMTVVQVLERNRESKADPARRPGNPSKRSRLDQDIATPFEGESPAGRLPKMALFGGLWTVWPVPVSEVGSIARMRFRTSGPASKFCLALFGKPITANQLAAVAPNPLASGSLAAWRASDEVLVDRYGWIETFGKDGQAAGYHPGQESEGDSVTGKLDESASVEYVSEVPPWVWVAMWSPASCFIEGRIYPSPVQ